MRPRDALLAAGRLLVGFVLAFLLFEATIGAYTSFLASGLDAGIDLLQPDELLLSEIEADGTQLRLYYSPRNKISEAGARQTSLDQWFYFDVSSLGTWDFVVVLALFCGFAAGPVRKILVRLALLLALLAILDFISFGALMRYGYDPAVDEYRDADVVLMGPWVQQVLPVALWLLLCPTRLQEWLRTGRTSEPSGGTDVARSSPAGRGADRAE